MVCTLAYYIQGSELPVRVVQYLEEWIKIKGIPEINSEYLDNQTNIMIFY